MTKARKACPTFVSTGAVIALMALALQAADPRDFKADATLTGAVSALAPQREQQIDRAAGRQSVIPLVLVEQGFGWICQRHFGNLL